MLDVFDYERERTSVRKRAITIAILQRLLSNRVNIPMKLYKLFPHLFPLSSIFLLSLKRNYSKVLSALDRPLCVILIFNLLSYMVD